MNRKTATLFGAAAATALATAPALASPPPADPAVPQATSYSDLLTPIPNARERLQLADAQEAQAQLTPAQFVVQYGYDRHHHHHHHHHNRYWYLRHGYVWYNGGWVLRPRYHHHHHHHHHNHDYNNGYYDNGYYDNDYYGRGY